MKTLRLLLSAALVFWGWMIGQPWLGTLGAVLLEGGRLLKWRWELAENDLARLWDACVLAAGVLFVYFFVLERSDTPAFSFVQWLPAALFPVVVAQQFGPYDKISFRVMSIIIRRRRQSSVTGAINISYLYFALCLYAASATNRRDYLFFSGTVLLVGWALWVQRSRRPPGWFWAPLFTTAVLAAYVLQLALPRWQELTELRLNRFLSARARPDLQDFSRTAIGDLGRLKLSHRILLRVTTPEPEPPLLRRASFQAYTNGVWSGTGRRLAAIPSSEDDAWTFLPGVPATHRLGVSGFIGGRRAVLPVPTGLARMRKLPAASVETNVLGVVRAEETPPFLDFTAEYTRQTTMDGAAEAADVDVPANEQDALRRVLETLALTNRAAPEALAILGRFFEREFQYTTYLGIPAVAAQGTNTPLGRFLLEDRAGHCEYFATAATLLLRQLGLPARYATGYAVQEKASQDAYVVRERHAHAWCLVYYQGTWQDFDPTPPSWNSLEARTMGWTTALSDFGSWLWHEFTRWRYQKSNWRQYILWALIPIAVLLFASVLLRSLRRGRPAGNSAVPRGQDSPGADSEFYLVEAALRRLGIPRERGETLEQWLRRLGSASTLRLDELGPILRLHYRHRFHPQGLAPAERERLRTASRHWADQLRHPRRKVP